MATMADIAKRAGVALSTVSHTLSGKRPVSKEVRQRVYQAIAELEYQPHMLARALATKRSQTVALLFPFTLKDALVPHIDFVKGALTAAKQREYDLLLSAAEMEEQEIRRIIQHGFVDGLILMEVRLHDPRVQLLQERGYPFALIGRCQQNEGISFVDLDFDYSVHLCVEHIAMLGHKHVAFVISSQAQFDDGVGYVARSQHAFYQSLREFNIEGIALNWRPGLEDCLEAAQLFLNHHPETSAIISVNPTAINAVNQVLQARGMSVPQDFSLVGLVPPSIAEVMNPPLTNVDFPFDEMGRLGVDILIRKLEGEEQEPQQTLLRPDLVIRQSTAPYRPHSLR